MTATATSTEGYRPRVPGGTRVLHAIDGESGVVMNGFAYDPERGWTEYEVETRHGVERWQRGDFVPFDELGAE